MSNCIGHLYLFCLTKENQSVIGAGVMGGGFGGCTINIVEKDHADDFIKSVSEAYKNKLNINCSAYFDNISNGTHLVN